AGEPARQQVDGFGACLRPVRARALHHLRQQQLQADRNAAGLCSVCAVAAAAQAHRLRLRMPGVRSSGIARAVAKLRAGQQADPDRARLNLSPGRTGAQDSIFDAFSSREPVPTSLENALTAGDAASASPAFLPGGSSCGSSTIWIRARRLVLMLRA